ncbi:MAG: tetratricopeptide repeat protein, partial [Methylocella sp.]
MSPLGSAWDWVSNKENRETLAFIGGPIVVVITGAWAAYLHFSKKPKESSTVTFNFSGITLEQSDARLKSREQEIRAELALANAADKALLEKQLSDIQAKLGNSEAALEDYKSKLAHADQALDDLKKELMPEPLEQARVALQKGETSDAEALFKKVLSGGKEKAAEAAYQLGQLADGRIDYLSAYQYYKQTAELQPDNPLYLNAAGEIDQTVGRYSEAEPLLQRALSIREKTLGSDHPDVGESVNNLAQLYAAQGQYAKAEPLHQRALAIAEKALGPEHPHVAASLNNLALLYDAQGKYAQAEPLYRRALVISEKTMGPEDPSVGTCLNNLAEHYRTQGKYAQAEPLYQRAIAIVEKTLGPEHPDEAKSLNNLALL